MVGRGRITVTVGRHHRTRNGVSILSLSFLRFPGQGLVLSRRRNRVGTSGCRFGRGGGITGTLERKAFSLRSTSVQVKPRLYPKQRLPLRTILRREQQRPHRPTSTPAPSSSSSSPPWKSCIPAERSSSRQGRKRVPRHRNGNRSRHQPATLEEDIVGSSTTHGGDHKHRRSASMCIPPG